MIPKEKISNGGKAKVARKMIVSLERATVIGYKRAKVKIRDTQVDLGDKI